MAIIAVAQVQSDGKRSASWAVGSGRSYTQTLRVQTDNAYDGPQSAVRSCGVTIGDVYRSPLLGEPTEWDSGSFVQSITADEVGDDGCEWLLTISYGPYDLNGQGGSIDSDGVINPFQALPEVSWGSATYERYEAEDVEGKPFVNAAGDPLEDPPPMQDDRPVLTITRNEPHYASTIVELYKGRVNADPFLGFEPGTVKVLNITGRRQYSADWGVYWEVTYEFEYRPDGWKTELLNAGMRQVKGLPADGVLEQILIDGVPVTSPVTLTEGGRYDPKARVKLEFTLYKEALFAGLNIPQDLLESS